ncbi:cyclic nucleotide-binding domain-containing protein [Candidatus Dependentiae bacterium]|nr:cyclic nucleotide-binding domain-containing protein [Candidatus Dependentiae bacterium]
MNIKNNQSLFNSGQDDKKVYILAKGEVKLFLKSSLTDNEYPLFSVKDAGAIFGIVENVLNIKRILTVKSVSDETDVNVIDLAGKNLTVTVQSNPKLGLQFAINLALRLKNTNNQLTSLSKILNDIRTNTNNLCIQYYDICEEINQLNGKYQFPWLKAIYEQAKINLIYKYGSSAKAGKDVLEEMVEARKNVVGSVEKENLETSGAKIYKPGDVVCTEGDIGKEMFILLDGELSVYVNNNKVAEITKKGEILGEIAVLLGLKTKSFEKRTATVKVKKEAKILSIPFDKIFEVINRDPKVIVHIMKTLSERTPESYNKLTETYEKMDKAINLMNPSASTSATCPKAFQQMITLINQKANDKDKVDAILKKLDKLIDDAKKDYNKYSEIYDNLIK